MSFAKILLIALLALFFAPFSVSAEKVTKTTTLNIPDIHEDFCGAKIDYRICKCARHGEMCKDINRERNIANYILNSRYNIYVSTLRAQFAATCAQSGGKFHNDKCDYIEKTEGEKKCLPEDFGAQWKKYSDIDEAIPLNERSFEAKSLFETGAKLKDAENAIYVLKRDIELNQLMLGEFKEFRKAVATNFKVNMLKSFWRLAWLTYDTTAGAAAPMRLGSEGTWLFQGGTDLGRSFAKLFADDLVHGQKIGILAKLARESMGDSSRYAFDTTTMKGKFGAITMTTLISALENVDSPVEVAKEMFQEITKQSLPNVDVKLSDEDIALLADQYKKTMVLDDVLQEAYRKRAQLAEELETQTATRDMLKAEFLVWEEKERTRTENNLVDACKK